MDQHLGCEERYEIADSKNSRNGSKPKCIRSKYGEKDIGVSQDCERSFEPKIVRKCQKISKVLKIKSIAIYAKSLTTRQISEQIEDIYGLKVSEGMASGITKKLLPEIEG